MRRGYFLNMWSNCKNVKFKFRRKIHGKMRVLQGDKIMERLTKQLGDGRIVATEGVAFVKNLKNWQPMKMPRNEACLASGSR